MRFRKYRFQNADPVATGGGSATMMTDGAQTTPAATSSAPADVAALAATNTGAIQQLSDDAKTAADEATAAASTPEAIAKAAEDKAAADKLVYDNTAPEKYEIKAADGMTLDAVTLGEFEGLARELNLSQEKAQKVTDLGAKMAERWATSQAVSIHARHY